MSPCNQVSPARAFPQDPDQETRRINAGTISDKPANRRSYQHRLAERLIVNFSIELETAPKAGEHEGQAKPIQFEGFRRNGAGDGHRNGNNHKGREQHRLEHRALHILRPSAQLAGDSRDDAAKSGQAAEKPVDDADSDVGPTPIFIGLNAGRARP